MVRRGRAPGGAAPCAAAPVHLARAAIAFAVVASVLLASAAIMPGPARATGSLVETQFDGQAGMTIIRRQRTFGDVGLSEAVNDMSLRLRVSTDKVATGRGQMVAVVARQDGARGEYRLVTRFLRDGTVSLQLVKLADGRRTALVNPLAVGGLRHVAGAAYWVRADVTGSAPARLRLKVWRDG